MKSKYLISIIVIALIAISVFFALKYSSNKQPAVTPESNNQNVNPPQQPSITPINTNVGSVAGVDLRALGVEANESGLNSLQDGASDATSLSSGATFNSAIDSVNNPIQ